MEVIFDPFLKCPACKGAGHNMVEDGWYVCECGNSIMEYEEEENDKETRPSRQMS